jgi:hypothetical protein
MPSGVFSDRAFGALGAPPGVPSGVSSGGLVRALTGAMANFILPLDGDPNGSSLIAPWFNKAFMARVYSASLKPPSFGPAIPANTVGA